jgi:RNA-binding protein 5/10
LATLFAFIQKNLANESLRQTAKEKVAKLQNASTSASSATANAKQVYRDRASERRVIHGQPDIPLPEVSGTSSSTGGKKIRDVVIPTPAPPAPPPKEPAKDENNIGNKLLKKMGWSEGTGLGLSGEGRVDPMFVSFFRRVFGDIADGLMPCDYSQTAMYASGAGLGASKGKDITKVAGLDYAALSKESVSDEWTVCRLGKRTISELGGSIQKADYSLTISMSIAG